MGTGVWKYLIAHPGDASFIQRDKPMGFQRQSSINLTGLTGFTGFIKNKFNRINRIYRICRIHRIFKMQ
jgi:hypothetical protein